MEDNDLEFPDGNDLLISARKDFAAFCRIASLHDKLALDSLVLAKAAPVYMVTVPRQQVAPVVRDGAEQPIDSIADPVPPDRRSQYSPRLVR